MHSMRRFRVPQPSGMKPPPPPATDRSRARVAVVLFGLLAGAPSLAVARELPGSAAVRAELQAAIEARGFVCPSANMLHAFGPGPYGTIVQVWCGPPGTGSVYERLVYRVDMRPLADGLMSLRITPWRGDPFRAPRD
jgi:hypothetical protein